MDIGALITQLMGSSSALVLFGVWAYMVFRFLASEVGIGFGFPFV